jgi:predicted dehydrogenase
MKQQPMSRRRFLGQAAAAGGVMFVPRRVLGGQEGQAAPNEKLNIACVGVGGRAEAHVNVTAEQHNLVAICDTDKSRLGAVAGKNPKAKTYADYRKMLEEVAKEIDAVFVGTPDHHHALATMIALRLGKHVYCEKPLTHSVWEARQVTEAARKAKVATQMGNQGFSKEGTRMLAEWVAAGAIGGVKEAHLWTDRPIWPQGIEERPPAKQPPAKLDWDLWLGPAPAREYHDGLHPFAWRGWWDFGCGALGDMGCHGMAPVFFALKLGYPTAVEAETSGVLKESAPTWSIVRYEFPAREGLPPVKLTWYDGKKKPPRPEDLEEDRQLGDSGTLLVGDKGKIMVVDDNPRVIPEAKMKEFKRPAKTLPRIPAGNHHQDWFIACKGGRPACSNFDFAGPLTEAVLAGNVAIRTGKRLEWDGPGLKATNAPEADAFIRREYRKGWTW